MSECSKQVYCTFLQLLCTATVPGYEIQFSGNGELIHVHGLVLVNVCICVCCVCVCVCVYVCVVCVCVHCNVCYRLLM